MPGRLMMSMRHGFGEMLTAATEPNDRAEQGDQGEQAISGEKRPPLAGTADVISSEQVLGRGTPHEDLVGAARKRRTRGPEDEGSMMITQAPSVTR